MPRPIASYTKIYIWQLLFVVTGTGWLLAPLFNLGLSNRTSLISEYETLLQPFAWVFRSTDAIAALLLIGMVLYMRLWLRLKLGWRFPALLVVGGLMLLDILIPTDCLSRTAQCALVPGPTLYLHIAETVLLAGLILAISLRNALKAETLTSTFFVAGQVIFFAFVLSGFNDKYALTTVTQYAYQFLTIIWLAWYIRELLPPDRDVSLPLARVTRIGFAIWAYLNGVLAIVGSLWHIPVFGVLHSLYFGTGTAWLAQHGVVAGVAMLYVSRHLWRGELRARQLFLALLFLQVIKYAVVTPVFWLLILYSLTFAILFVCRPYFMRGSVRQPWLGRLQEISLLLAGVAASLAIVGMILIYNPSANRIATQAWRHGSEFIINHHPTRPRMLNSYLLTRTFSALVIALAGAALWSLFRPVPAEVSPRSGEEREEIRRLLEAQSTSSEDYFKYWPPDKSYYWSKGRASCIAYKTTKTVVFALADPVGGTRAARLQLVQRFTADWAARGFAVCFLLVDEANSEWYEKAGLKCVQVGASAVVDVADFTTETIKEKWWRWQRNRAIKSGYQYSEHTVPHSSEFIAELQTVSDAWLARPGHREQGLLLGSFSQEYIQASTIHCVRNEQGEIIAFANQVPIYNNRPQTTVDMMRFQPEYDNVMPYLLSELISQLQQDGVYTKFDLGFVPLADMDNPLTKIGRTVAANRFSAAGLEQFKNKFDPEWHKNYLAYTGDIGDLAAIALKLEDALSPSDHTT